MSLAIVHSRAKLGIQAPPVTVEVHLANGMPSLTLVGMPETAVRESKDRVRSALQNARLDFPSLKRITINLAPADLPKEGGRFDLAIALGLLMASNQIPADSLQHCEALGELALSGELRPVQGVLPAALACRDQQRTLLVPRANAAEAALVPGVRVIAAEHLLELCEHLRGERELPPVQSGAGFSEPAPVADLAEVQGQAQAKRALIVAAAGSHNLLLFGPPGTGKTLLAKAVAREAEANFIATKSSDLLSKWYGESEQQIARLFQRARQVAPTVIFIDEIDSLAPARGGGLGEPAVTERVVNTLLAEMDGLEELRGVVVIAASNRPALLDPALLRPGRFDDLVYVPVPGREGRLHILRIHTAGMPLADDVDLEALADRTQGYTGADLEDLVRRAGLEALREDINSEIVDASHFEAALAETRASVTKEMEQEYEELLKTLKSESPRGPKRIGFSVAAQEIAAD